MWAVAGPACHLLAAAHEPAHALLTPLALTCPSLPSEQAFKPVQLTPLEAPDSSVGLGGEGSCLSEPGSPVLVGAAALRFDGITGGLLELP